MTKDDERRDSWRAPVQVSLRKPGDRWGEEAAGDISMGGARAIFSRVPPATRVEVKVRLPDREIRALGDIIRASPAAGGMKNAHIKFATLANADAMAIAKYLDEVNKPAPQPAARAPDAPGAAPPQGEPPAPASPDKPAQS